MCLENEGKVIVIAEKDKADNVVTILYQYPYGRNAKIVGEVINDFSGQVGIETISGGIRILTGPREINSPESVER